MTKYWALRARLFPDSTLDTAWPSDWESVYKTSDVDAAMAQAKLEVWEEAAKGIDLRILHYKDTRDINRAARDMQINEAIGCAEWCRAQADKETP